MRRLVLPGKRLARWGRPSSPKGSAPSQFADPPFEGATKYFVPPGYLPLLKAVHRWATKENALAWTADIHPREGAIYEGLGSSYEVQDLYDLWNNPGPNCPAAVSAAGRRRLELLNAANLDVRNGLAAGDLIAVEHTRATGRIEEIDPLFWTSDSAASVFAIGKRFRTIGRSQYEIRILIPVGLTKGIGTRSSSPENLAAPERLRSGAPGRPTSMHLIIAEAGRQIAAKVNIVSKAQFGRDLSRWFKGEHPEYPPVTPKTVTNNKDITRLFRAAQSEALISKPKTPPEMK